MRVVIAEGAGFCGGVKRAMRIAMDAAERHGGVRADGPLVHNRTACDLLALHGVVENAGEAKSPVLIRAHGVTPEQRRRWLEEGAEIIDATCVHVARNQRLAAEAADAGALVLIAGDADHAEVRAVAGCAPDSSRVVAGVDDIERLETDRPVFMLAQTTFNVDTFNKMTQALLRLRPDSRVVDTICRATHDRQEEAGRLADATEAVVVVGGRHSANTRRLAEAVEAAGKPAFAVETAADLRPEDFAGFSRVGVTSGASTPGWITQEVVNTLRTMGRCTVAERFRALLVPLTECRATTALAAAGLALAAQRFLTDALSPALALAGAGFVFFAHILNRRVPADPDARRLSLADGFYRQRRLGLLGLAWCGAAAALALSATEGAPTFLLFAAAIAATSAYAWTVRKSADEARSRFAPAPARNAAMAVGWALTLAGPPGLTADWTAGAMGAGAFVFLICFGGTLIRDLHDIASDRLMGIQTMPASLGPGRGRRLAGLSLVIAGCLPVVAALRHIHAGGALGWWFVFVALLPGVPCIGLHLLEQMKAGKMRDAIALQAGVDVMGIAAGALAILG